MEISWPGEFGEIHTKILERMKRVLEEDNIYPYLKPNAKQRIDNARKIASNTSMLERNLVYLGGFTWCLFPWLGTRSFRALRKMISMIAPEFGISGIDFEGCYYIKFRMEKGTPEALLRRLKDKFERADFDPIELVSPKELPTFEKYDRYVPADLLRIAYSQDRLNTQEAVKRIEEMTV
jgi:ATP-dependent Lhr-like helicase